MGLLDDDNLNEALKGLPRAGHAAIGSLAGSVLDAGEGGTVTKEMVDNAQKIKSATDQANG
ncbi:hypothetical protein [Streptomyces syringium]|uniref:hypothetical protein n=1 Tax=Streptomyces syringium TaxID=76729 RepID=UPI00342E6695